MLDQAEWGSSREYADGELSGLWDPQVVVIHWGGLTNQVSPMFEASVLQGWQRYHIGKGWRDIAYNYAVGDSGTFYRLRGENPSGATSGYNEDGVKWNNVAVNVVWIGGQRDVDGPSVDAIAAMVLFLDSRGLPVLGHVQTGKATACPGGDWLQFIEDYNNGEYNMAEEGKKTSNPAFQAAWDKAIKTGFYTKWTDPSDPVTAEKLAVFMDRAGLLVEEPKTVAKAPAGSDGFANQAGLA